MGVMQRMSSAAARRDLRGLAARRRSVQEPQARPWACLFIVRTRPLGRDATFLTRGSHNRTQWSAFSAGQKYRRYCTSDSEPKQAEGHPDISVVGSPDPITWIRNTVLIYLIELRFELRLNSDEFRNGVKQALVHVSGRMSTGRFDELRGAVSSEMVDYVEERCRSLTEAQRRQLSVSPDDIIFLLPEEVEVLQDQRGRKFCLVVIRFWFLSCADGPEDPEATRIFKMAAVQDAAPQKRIVTAVYEFHRELTTGADPDWTVTSIWHWPWTQTA